MGIIVFFKENCIICISVILSLIIHGAFFTSISSKKTVPTEILLSIDVIAPIDKKSEITKAINQNDETQQNKQKQNNLEKPTPQKKDIKREIVKKTRKEPPIIAKQETTPKVEEEIKNTTPKTIENNLQEANNTERTNTNTQDKDIQADNMANISTTSQKAEYIKLNFDFIRNSLMQELSYPEKARRQGIEGKGAVALIINNDGSIKNVILEREFGNKMLNEAALKAGKKIRKVKPTHLDEVRVIIPITFSLL